MFGGKVVVDVHGAEVAAARARMGNTIDLSLKPEHKTK
jgi:hypothetical protein